jgi:hypothetical protein
VFFKPELNVNGGTPDETNKPCWYLFWQNGAVADLDDFEYKHQNWYGESQLIDGFFWDTHILRVGYIAGPTLVGGSIVGGTHYPAGLLINGTEFGGATGIDCCSEVVVHEKMHNTLAGEINNGATDNDPPVLPLYNYNGDWLPDNREAALGCNINNKDTFNLAGLKAPVYAGYGDNEYAVMVEARGITGDSSKDWSKGGKQW